MNVSKWYKPDDECVPLKRKRLTKPKPYKVRKNIQPG